MARQKPAPPLRQPADEGFGSDDSFGDDFESFGFAEGDSFGDGFNSDFPADDDYGDFEELEPPRPRQARRRQRTRSSGWNTDGNSSLEEAVKPRHSVTRHASGLQEALESPKARMKTLFFRLTEKSEEVFRIADIEMISGGNFTPGGGRKEWAKFECQRPNGKVFFMELRNTTLYQAFLSVTKELDYPDIEDTAWKIKVIEPSKKNSMDIPIIELSARTRDGRAAKHVTERR